jgi:signal transduction histidine kinase
MSNNEIGIDGQATSIEAFIDIDQGRITVIDNGDGIAPDILSGILNHPDRICPID